MGTKYEFGPFMLDPSESSLWRDGVLVEIAPKEFSVLVFFIENRHRLLTKDEILEKNWPDQVIDETTWTKSLYRLRHALCDDGHTYIQCLPRRGYRFVCPVKGLRDVSECIEETESLTQPVLDRIATTVEDMDRRLLHLEALVLQSSTTNHIEKSDVIEVLPEEERADVFFKFARTVSPNLSGAEQHVWLAKLDNRSDDLQSALSYYQRTDADRELDMICMLGRFWDIRGNWKQAQEAIERALIRQKPGDSELKANAMTWLGYFLGCQSQYNRNIQVLTEAVAMGKRVEDKKSQAISLHLLGCTAEVQCRYSDARRFLAASLEISTLDWLNAWTARAMGKVAEAEGDYAFAHKCHQKAISLGETVGDIQGMAATLNSLGVVAREREDRPQSRIFIDRGLTLSHDDGYKQGIAYGLLHLGVAEEEAGRYQGARDFYDKSLIVHRDNGNKRGVSRAMEGIARAEVLKGNEKEGVRVLSAADALRGVISAPMSPAEKKKYGWLTIDLQKKFPEQFEAARK